VSRDIEILLRDRADGAQTVDSLAPPVQVRRRGDRRRTARRGCTVAAAALVVMGAAVAVGNLPSNQSVSASSSWSPIPVQTNGWSGGLGLQALLQGTLERDNNGCLGLGPGNAVQWPAGYTGRISPSGVVEVLNAGGQVVARTGQWVKLGGGLRPPGAATGPCQDGYEVFDVESNVAPLAP
jgi:hypothetical protein